MQACQRQFLVIASLLSFAFTFITHVALRADGPADNNPATVRPVPPEGIQVPTEKLKELEREASALAEQAAAVSRAEAVDRHQVTVFARAVRMAVEDGMFYTDKEVDQAFNLIKFGKERLEALRSGKSGRRLMGANDSPQAKVQLVVGGYQSRIDGSIQPYGLVLPADTELVDARPLRLDVWLHGRGEKLSEAAFLTQRLNAPGEITPPGTIVLHPYGRYCNANKFAGEVDVLEAIASVQRLFPIDIDRINIRGFSMGGAGCWQMAVHYPGLWMAATPGAGFSETRQFLKVFQKEDFVPSASQNALLHWFDCPDWSNNLRLLPTVAYSGEIDNQKQAADVMEAAMKQRGLTLKHIIGPQTGHKIHPDSKVEIEKFLADVAKQGRNPVPLEIDFTTYTLRYANNAWLTIEGLGQHWKEARVVAKLEPPQSISLKTTNVTRISITLPITPAVLDRTVPIRVAIDDSQLQVPAAADGQPVDFTLAKTISGWSVVSNEERGDALRKRPGLQGPIDDAFLDAFVFVGPTANTDSNSNPIDKWAADEFARAKREWRRHYRGDIVQRSAESVTAADIANNNLVLFGTPQSNPMIARILSQLPIEWKDNKLSLGQHTFNDGKHAPMMIYPNPLNPSRYVVINSGFTFREYAYLNNARQIPMLPDWAIIDVTTGVNQQTPGKIEADGFFDETWR